MKNSNPSVLPLKWVYVLCGVAAIYAVSVLAYIVIETGKPLGSRDFHQFWYAGHFILQGRDPYEAFFEGEQPRLPIRYLDGITINQYPVAQPELEITPSNTPAMLLLLSPLAYFSWQDAKWSFMLINMVLMLVTGWLVLRRISFMGVKLNGWEELLIFLVYFDLSATRIAIENGQTTLLVFLLMLLALIEVDRAWPLSGISLGMALSKYSLSLPVFLFFLYKRKWKVLLVAIFVQLLGILGISAISGSSPVTIVYENIMLFFRLFDQPGVHLSRWFEFLSTNHFLSLIPSLVMTALVFVLMLFWTHRTGKLTPDAQEVVDFHVLTILFIWVILVAYHRLYDTLILLFFLVLVFKGLAVPAVWNFTRRGRAALLAFIALLPLVFILPARIVDKVLPDYYGRISDAVTSFLILIMLGVSMYLLHRSLQILRTHRQWLNNRLETPDLPSDAYASPEHGGLISN